MKNIEVVAAIIKKDNKYFVTQRGYGDYKDWWEFPGGKIEEGETPEEALIREIKEELDADIIIDKYLCTVEHGYPKYHIKMDCYMCSLISEDITLKEHEAAKWLSIDEMGSINLLPIDVKVVEELKSCIKIV